MQNSDKVFPPLSIGICELNNCFIIFLNQTYIIVLAKIEGYLKRNLVYIQSLTPFTNKAYKYVTFERTRQLETIFEII